LYCVRCGTGLQTDERFCQVCGAPASLAAPPAPAAGDARPCPHCKARTQAGHQFCWSCGESVTAAPAAPRQRAGKGLLGSIPFWTIALGFLIGLVIAAAVLLVFVALNPQVGSVFDAEQAERVARIALPSDQDLPGEGWHEGAGASADAGLLNDLAANPVCAAMQEQLADLDSVLTQQRAGRARRMFTRDPTAQAMTPTRVEVQVHIYRDPSRLGPAIIAQQAFLDGDAFRDCLDQGLVGGLRASDHTARIEVTKAPAQATTPHFGVARAYDIDFSLRVTPGSAISGGFRIEVYSWQYSNARAEVVLFGGKGEITPHLAEVAVDTTQTGLQRAEKVKR
jgi:hypothetical protein